MEAELEHLPAVDAPRTSFGGTVTTEGWIEHKQIGNMYFPVKIQRRVSVFKGESKKDGKRIDCVGWKPVTDGKGVPVPLRNSASDLVYAYPGGGEF